MIRAVRYGLVVLLFGPLWFAWANPEAPTKSDYQPTLAKASDEAVKAIPQFKRDQALTIDVWAAEPMLAHPVAFAFDEKGRCYVAETFRHSRGVTDNRSHMNWLDDELALRTVAERVELYRKDAKAKFAQTYEKERERVRLLEDTTGSLKADKATVFCDDFGRAEDGIGAGLLARQGNVYFTCIPDLWLLKDTKGTGTADVKQSLSTGYGVHTAFIGHDLHGLRIGPDGKLYFSVGDRGLNVTAKDGKKLYYPDGGAVMRCDLDGGNLELVATGLRNPQELAFDDYGNLFTVDNNSDSGDQARFVHIVEGGDSGWRIGYQYGSAMHDSSVKQGNRGPWNYELLWRPQGENRAAYVVPPIVNYANGPSGFTAYPGIGLSERYQNHFFLANFSGQPGGSGIYSFGIKPKGASFEMTDAHQFVWNILATDCEFGPDGGFYISDWVNGWNINGKGRIYRVTDATAMKNPAIPEAKALLAEGFAQRSTDELLKLLAHPHRQVRQEAHFALADKGAAALPGLAQVAKKHANRLARLHAVWGLGMAGRKHPDAYTHVGALLNDPDVEIRAHAARVYGDAPRAEAKKLLPLLADSEPRVQMMACFGLARGTGQADAPAIRAAVFALLKANADKDPVLRHAASLALAKRVPAPQLSIATTEDNAAVRLGCVLALRKNEHPGVAEFLHDSDSKIVDEAARAISDTPILEALPKLAALSTKTLSSPYTAYRVVNAHNLLRTPENATALANYAARADGIPAVRALALKMLGTWDNPPRRDSITGLTQKLPPRDRAVAVAALQSVLAKVFAGPEVVLKEAVATSTKLGMKEVGPFLQKIAYDSNAPAPARIDALNSLQAINDPQVTESANMALVANDPKLRNAGRAILFKTETTRMLGQVKEVLNGSNLVEQQGVFALLAANASKDTDALLLEWLERTAAKKVAPELVLDILEAADSSKNAELRAKLKAINSQRAKDDPLANYRETLVGGDAVRGRDLFLNKSAVQCQRCHQLEGQGGEVGPPVNGVGKQPRDYLLEAIVLPSKAIAKGYESVSILTYDGKTVSGVLRGEDAKEVRLVTPEGKMIVIKKDNIDERKATKSAMPEDLAPQLTKRELRDLVEFLATLKEEWNKKP